MPPYSIPFRIRLRPGRSVARRRSGWGDGKRVAGGCLCGPGSGIVEAQARTRGPVPRICGGEPDRVSLETDSFGNGPACAGASRNGTGRPRRSGRRFNRGRRTGLRRLARAPAVRGVARETDLSARTAACSRTASGFVRRPFSYPVQRQNRPPRRGAGVGVRFADGSELRVRRPGRPPGTSPPARRRVRSPRAIRWPSLPRGEGFLHRPTCHSPHGVTTA